MRRGFFFYRKSNHMLKSPDTFFFQRISYLFREYRCNIKKITPVVWDDHVPSCFWFWFRDKKLFCLWVYLFLLPTMFTDFVYLTPNHCYTQRTLALVSSHITNNFFYVTIEDTVFYSSLSALPALPSECVHCCMCATTRSKCML